MKQPTDKQLSTLDPLIDAAVDATLEHRLAESGKGGDLTLATAKRDAALLALLKQADSIGIAKPSATVVASVLSTASDIAHRHGKLSHNLYSLVSKGKFLHECLQFADKHKFSNT